MSKKLCVRYRCRHARCRQRRTLRHPVEWYVREPRCKACGGPLTRDRFRNEQELRAVCTCDGYWFPHRPGGGVWCEQHPTGPTEEEMRERYPQVCRLRVPDRHDID